MLSAAVSSAKEECIAAAKEDSFPNVLMTKMKIMQLLNIVTRVIENIDPNITQHKLTGMKIDSYSPSADLTRLQPGLKLPVVRVLIDNLIMEKWYTACYTWLIAIHFKDKHII